MNNRELDSSPSEIIAVFLQEDLKYATVHYTSTKIKKNNHNYGSKGDVNKASRLKDTWTKFDCDFSMFKTKKVFEKFYMK